MGSWRTVRDGAPTLDLDRLTSVAQFLIAWQHTAEVHSDPDPLAALTRDHDADYGPPPDPRETR